MKNKIALLLLPLGLLGLVGCNEGKVEVELPTYLKEVITKARKSYTLSGQVKTSIYKTSDDSLILEDDENIDIKFISGKDAKLNQIVQNEVDGELVTSNVTLVKNEDGYVSKESLNYQNEVIKNPLRFNGSKVQFDTTFKNPFELIKASDFEMVDESTFTLNPSKSLLFTNALYFNENAIKSVTFNYKDEVLKNIKVVQEPKIGSFLDQNTNAYVEVRGEVTGIFILKEIGETVIPGITKVASRNKEKENILKTALDGLGSNYTIIMNEHDRGTSGNPDSDEVWYFNGSDKVYHQRSFDDHSRKYDLYYKADKTLYGDDKLRLYDFDEKSNSWEYNEPIYSQSYNSNPRDYSYFVPKNESIAPELFKYDEARNVYICDVNEVIGYLGNNFLPGCYQIGYFTNGQGDKCEIALDQNNKVKDITIGYTRILDGYELSTDFVMKFIGIGTTEIPSWVEGK